MENIDVIVFWTYRQIDIADTVKFISDGIDDCITFFNPGLLIYVFIYHSCSVPIKYMKNPQKANVFPKNMRFSSQAKKPQKRGNFAIF